MKEGIIVQVAMADAELQIRDRLDDDARVHLGESLVEGRDLRVNHQRTQGRGVKRSLLKRFE